MARPTLRQAQLCYVALITASVALLPLSLLVSVTAWLLFRDKSRPSSEKKPTALVNGGRMQKSIYVARALAANGYRVILVEERGWGEFCAARFSSSVSRFYLVKGGGGEPYIDSLVNVMLKEKVDLFVPCSGAGTTLEDAKAAKIIREHSKGKVNTLIQNPDLAETLHEKDRFINLVLALGLDAPSSHFIQSPEEAIQLMQKPEQPPFILKAANILDDVGRGDLTNFPLLDEQHRPDWSKTREKLEKGLYIPMTPKTPYIAQEFVGGKGASEWCTHATVIDGKITAFACCPSNDLLMTYHDATNSEIGRRTLKWTKSFLARLSEHPEWKGTRLTGLFSMDFIYQPSSDRLVVIECNPRVHTAIGLLTGSQQADQALGKALDGTKTITTLMPLLGTPSMSWWGHDVIARIIPSYLPLPRSLLESIHPLWSKNRSGAAHLLFDLESVGRDGAWDRRDPFVFFALYHIQMPFLLLRQLFLRRKAYSRINISTARVFEC